MIHLRNGRAFHKETWCGKKLLGKPINEDACVGTETFNCYGSDVTVSDDPASGDCPICRERFDTAYNAAFPEGLKPIATFKLDDPDVGEKFRAFVESMR